jgi:hypothetical protein
MHKHATESQNAERLVRYLDSLGAEPATPRVREYALMLGFLVLLAMHLESTDVSHQIVAEKSECQINADRAEKFSNVIVAAANNGAFTIGDDRISCRRTK